MKNKDKIIIIGILGSLVLLFCLLLGYDFYKKNNKTNGSNSSSITEVEDVNWDNYEEKEVTDSENVTITEGGVYTLTGNITSTVVVNTDEDVKLVLDNVTITASNGPAIYVESAKSVTIYLNDGTTNTVIDASNYSGYDQDVSGCIYSKDDLIFDGTGTLIVKANYQDGIVSKDDLVFYSGTYTVTAKDDGIRGKDSVYIKDGTFTIKASGDGIKASNDTDNTKGYVLIENGTFNITASSDGIQAITKLTINGGEFNITASEGLEATYIIINGGTIKISASDDGINASNKSNISTPTIEVNGGDIEVTMGQGDTDGFDANGNIYINGGTVKVTGQSTFDYDGEGKINGGTVYSNGTQVTTLPNQVMGGGNMQQRTSPAGGNQTGKRRVN